MRASAVRPFALLVAGALVAACSSDPVGAPPPFGGSRPTKTPKKERRTPDAEDESPEGEDPVPVEDPPQTTPPPSSPDAGTTPPPATCGNEATKGACYDCCERAHPSGIQFLQTSFKQCACGNGPGSCAAQCSGSYCAGAAPTAACAQCLDASSTCQAQADDLCTRNAACAALFQCDDASKCANKPGP